MNTTLTLPMSAALRLRLTLAGALAGFVVLIAPGGAQAQSATGSGTARSEVRSVPAFQAITLRAGYRLVLRQAARDAVEVRADDKLLPLIETQVAPQDGLPTLTIGTRRGATLRGKTDVVVTVDVADLRALSVQGAGEVEGDGLKSPALAVAIAGAGEVRLERLDIEALTLKISGSGDLQVSGRAPKLEVAIAGSGDIDAKALQADEVQVRIAGSGDVELQARKTLDVSIAGSGDVVYSGDAALKTRVAGSGNVTRR